MTNLQPSRAFNYMWVCNGPLNVKTIKSFINSQIRNKHTVPIQASTLLIIIYIKCNTEGALHSNMLLKVSFKLESHKIYFLHNRKILLFCHPLPFFLKSPLKFTYFKIKSVPFVIALVGLQRWPLVYKWSFTSKQNETKNKTKQNKEIDLKPHHTKEHVISRIQYLLENT